MQIKAQQRMDLTNSLINKAKERGIGLDRLSPRHRIVLERRATGETLAAIGRDFGVTRERIRQSENKAQKLLQRDIQRQSLDIGE